MRNGNRNFFTLIDWEYSVLTVPMRNGNSQFDFANGDYRAFLPYLWGMETTKSLILQYLLVTFLPYLWGMETEEYYRAMDRYIGSYRTYEEWKLSIPFKLVYENYTFLPYLWGMETVTKHNEKLLQTGFLPYLWGMETLNNFCHICRNLKFLPYLWGMETSLLSWIFGNGKRFLPYLWGMETGNAIHSCRIPQTVLTVPMRNGNKFSIFSRKSWILVLTVPMRNGNALALALLYRPNTVLTVPMRNGNPKILHSSPNRCANVLTVPMRNGNNKKGIEGMPK